MEELFRGRRGDVSVVVDGSFFFFFFFSSTTAFRLRIRKMERNGMARHASIDRFARVRGVFPLENLVYFAQTRKRFVQSFSGEEKRYKERLGVPVRGGGRERDARIDEIIRRGWNHKKRNGW